MHIPHISRILSFIRVFHVKYFHVCRQNYKSLYIFQHDWYNRMKLKFFLNPSPSFLPFPVLYLSLSLFFLLPFCLFQHPVLILAHFSFHPFHFPIFFLLLPHWELLFLFSSRSSIFSLFLIPTFLDFLWNKYRCGWLTTNIARVVMRVIVTDYTTASVRLCTLLYSFLLFLLIQIDTTHNAKPFKYQTTQTYYWYISVYICLELVFK